MKARFSLWFIFLVCMAVSFPAPAQTTSFTYQGSLASSGAVANGSYSFAFTLWNSATPLPGGPANQIGTLQFKSEVGVTNGLFTVTLDFGDVFDGSTRWLEIAVAPQGVPALNTLMPRQPINATPYATRAAGVTGPIAASQLSGTILPGNIAPGSISAFMIGAGAVGSNQLAAGGIANFNLADESLTTNKFVKMDEIQSFIAITNPPRVVGDNFGYAAAKLSASKVVISAPFNDTGAANSGVVYLFDLASGITTVVTNPTPLANDNFGNAVAAVGSSAFVVSAYRANDAGQTSAGIAYLMDFDGTVITAFTNPASAINLLFGNDVAGLGSSAVAIACVRADTNAGKVFVFATNGTLLATLRDPMPQNSESFGQVIAALGSDRIVVGAPNHDGVTTNDGSVYLFNTNGTLLLSITNPVPQLNATFGLVVAAFGTDKFLVGCPGFNSTVSRSGIAYLYDTNGTLVATFKEPSPVANARWGTFVAPLDDRRVMITGLRLGSPQAGAVAIYNLNGSKLATLTSPVPATSFDDFGYPTIALGPNTFLTTAEVANIPVSGSGMVYLITLSEYNPGLIAESVRKGAIGQNEINPALFANLARLDANQTFTGQNTFAGIRARGGPPGPFGELNNGYAFSGNGGDDDSGMFSSANGQVEFYSNSGERMRIADSGYVGIGTTSPRSPLHVMGDNEFPHLTVEAGSNAPYGAFLSLDASKIAGGKEYFVFSTGGFAGEGTGKFIIQNHTDNLPILTLTPNGNVGIGVLDPDTRLQVDGIVHATSFSTVSDRNAKENFQPVSPAEVLAKVAALPISKWSYKELPGATHMGPMAQDFFAAFGLGGNDKTITTVDPDGVALAAIQGLNQKVTKQATELEKKDLEIKELRNAVEDLKRMVQQIQRNEARAK